MEDVNKIKEILNDIINNITSGERNEQKLIDFIIDTESNMLDGTDSNGQHIIIGIQKGVGLQISTYQDNGWIRIHRFEIIENEEGNPEIQESETYEK